MNLVKKLPLVWKLPVSSIFHINNVTAFVSLFVNTEFGSRTTYSYPRSRLDYPVLHPMDRRRRPRPCYQALVLHIDDSSFTHSNDSLKAPWI